MTLTLFEGSMQGPEGSKESCIFLLSFDPVEFTADLTAPCMDKVKCRLVVVNFGV